MFNRIAIAIALTLASNSSFGQAPGDETWKFRFPDGNAREDSRRELDSRRIASLPSTKEFRAPKIRLPDLADTQIQIPPKRSRSPEDRDSKSRLSSSGDLSAPRSPPSLSDADPESLDNTRVASRDPYGILRTQFGSNLTPFDGTASFLPVRRDGSRFWVRAEYMLWYADNLETPALATTNPGGNPSFGVAGTSVLIGTGRLLDGLEDGYRLTVGTSLNPTGRFRIEGDYFRIFDRSLTQGVGSNGANPTNVIGRPYFDVAPGQANETARIISLNNVASGNVNVDYESRLRSYGVYARAGTCATSGPCDPIAGGLDNRFDFLVGYRYVNLEDVIDITDSVTGLMPPAAGNPGNLGTTSIRDGFQTDNRFRGIELGMVYHGTWNRFSTEFTSKMAVGRNRQTVLIGGYTDTTPVGGATTRTTGGLLTQTSNIGSFERDEYTFIPQLGLTLGTQLTNNFSLKFGYTLFYFSNVVRAGDQIDTDVNSLLVPSLGGVGSAVNLRPTFDFIETDYWAHGFTFGTDFRF